MNQSGMASEIGSNGEYVRGYQDGYWRGIEDARKGLANINMEGSILDVPLQGVGLSARAQRCLQRAGCATLRDAVVLPAESIRRKKPRHQNSG